MPLHEDVIIMTPDGEKPLKSLKKVSVILDGNGAFQNVLATIIDDYHGYFHEFCCKAIPFTFKCTADQLIFCAKDVPKTDDTDKITYDKPTFVRAGSISIYEYMAMPYLQEITEVLPISLPIEKDAFWHFVGVTLNRIALGKMPKLEASRVTIQLFAEELKLVKFPEELNKINTVGGLVILNPSFSNYISQIIQNPMQLLYLPLKCQAALYEGFNFDHERPPSSDNIQMMFVMWYIYCRVNKKLANIQSTKGREYRLNFLNNALPCHDYIWFRISDIRVTIEKCKIYHFKTETPSILARNFIVRPQ
ncbi:MAG TPA: hypothetical protein PKK26_09890 [Candidatus Wallbacteria bacterium]|nr:hypothetical protein [Candidatus Wallbacteria bacterium]